MSNFTSTFGLGDVVQFNKDQEGTIFGIEFRAETTYYRILDENRRVHIVDYKLVNVVQRPTKAQVIDRINKMSDVEFSRLDVKEILDGSQESTTRK